MFSRQMNQMRLDVSIVPEGPLLIRRGRQGADPTRPNMECVRTTVEGQSSVYIPGSSLKGVMRAHAERLMRCENLRLTDTFSENAKEAFDQSAEGSTTYSGSCPLGRTFGNLHIKGRVSVSDLVPGGHAAPGSDERLRQLDLANAVEQRNGVGINRLLGSAQSGALFDEEVVVQGRFDGRILLRNVQLYQLALVLLVLRDLGQGYVQLGSGTSRGHGFVKVTIRSLVIENHQGKVPPGQLWGVGKLFPNDVYQFFDADRVELPDGLHVTKELIYDRVTVPEARIDELAEALVSGPWTQFLVAAQGKGPWAA